MAKKTLPGKNITAAPVSASEISAQLPTAVLQDADSAGLNGIPYLGPTRREALALAGLRTRDDLHAADIAQIGGVKGVGMRNAERIKEWLRAQNAEPAEIKPAAVEIPVPAAVVNQLLQDELAQIDQAMNRVRELLTAKGLDDKLERQLQKIDSVISELPEGSDTLKSKQLKKANKELDRLGDLLVQAAEDGKLSFKKQVALSEQLKASRKKLEKILDM